MDRATSCSTGLAFLAVCREIFNSFLLPLRAADVVFIEFGNHDKRETSLPVSL